FRELLLLSQPGRRLGGGRGGGGCGVFEGCESSADERWPGDELCGGRCRGAGDGGGGEGLEGAGAGAVGVRREQPVVVGGSGLQRGERRVDDLIGAGGVGDGRGDCEPRFRGGAEFEADTRGEFLGVDGPGDRGGARGDRGRGIGARDRRGGGEGGERHVGSDGGPEVVGRDERVVVGGAGFEFGEHGCGGLCLQPGGFAFFFGDGFFGGVVFAGAPGGVGVRGGGLVAGGFDE